MASSSNVDAISNSSNASNDADDEISNSNSLSADNMSELKLHVEDDAKVSVGDRYSYVAGAVLRHIDNFTNNALKEEPFNFGKRSKTKAVKNF